MKKIFLLFLIVFSSFLICSCSKENSKEYTEFLYGFDTTIELKYKCEKNKADKIYNDISNMVKKYHQLTTRYDEYGNNVYTINHSTDFVEVDTELIDILNLSIKYQNDTNGYFNPLMGNITSIYKDVIQNKDTSKLLNLDTELDNLNNSKLIIEGNLVKIEGNATLDLGAIAKGYALEKIRKYFIEEGITQYLVNGGQSSIILGEKEGSFYKVGLKYTDSKVLSLKNTSVSVSSLNEQQVSIDDKTYHHIVNPLNGSNEFLYTTIYVIGTDASMIDAYSTAFFNMPLELIKEICEKENIQVLIYNNNDVLYERE